MKKLLSIISLLLLFETFVFADLTVNFMDKTYSLKWSNKNSAGGYTNEYIQSTDTFENYRTMITISEFTKTKDHVTAAKSIYSEFAKNVNAGKAVMATIDKINDKSVFVSFCAVAKTPKPNLECDYYNIQSANSGVMVYQFTQRYFLNEVKLTQKNIEQFLKDEMAKVKPYITKVTIPPIVNKEIDAKSSYIYGTEKNKQSK